MVYDPIKLRIKDKSSSLNLSTEFFGLFGKKKEEKPKSYFLTLDILLWMSEFTTVDAVKKQLEIHKIHTDCLEKAYKAKVETIEELNKIFQPLISKVKSTQSFWKNKLQKLGIHIEKVYVNKDNVYDPDNTEHDAIMDILIPGVSTFNAMGYYLTGLTTYKETKYVQTFEWNEYDIEEFLLEKLSKIDKLKILTNMKNNISKLSFDIDGIDMEKHRDLLNNIHNLADEDVTSGHIIKRTQNAYKITTLKDKGISKETVLKHIEQEIENLQQA